MNFNYYLKHNSTIRSPKVDLNHTNQDIFDKNITNNLIYSGSQRKKLKEIEEKEKYIMITFTQLKERSNAIIKKNSCLDPMKKSLAFQLS